MKAKDIHKYCVQEIWLDRDFLKEIDNNSIFHHDLKV